MPALRGSSPSTGGPRRRSRRIHVGRTRRPAGRRSPRRPRTTRARRVLPGPGSVGPSHGVDRPPFEGLPSLELAIKPALSGAREPRPRMRLDGQDRGSRHRALARAVACPLRAQRPSARASSSRRSPAPRTSRSYTPENVERRLRARPRLPGRVSRSRAASTRRCTAAGCGRCASSRASAPPRRRTSASATCSTTGRPGSRPRSTCRR